MENLVKDVTVVWFVLITIQLIITYHLFKAIRETQAAVKLCANFFEQQSNQWDRQHDHYIALVNQLVELRNYHDEQKQYFETKVLSAEKRMKTLVEDNYKLRSRLKGIRNATTSTSN